jgi:UPF0716 protein FxsA
MRFLALVFIIVPLTEMMLLFEVSDRIGGWPTLGMVVATAVIGLQILKRQGLSTLLRAQERLQSGALPAQEIIEAMLLAAAGALLLTPGFFTDTIGFLLLTGPLRRILARRLLHSGLVTTMSTGTHYRSWSPGAGTGDSGGTVVEGEYSHERGSLSDRRPEDSEPPLK